MASSTPYSTGLVGWQANGDSRSTWDLLRSSLLTIFACTYTVLHFNIPAPTDEFMRTMRRKVKWFTVTALIPEFLLYFALRQRMAASYSVRLFKKRLGRNTHFEWTMMHGFYVEMGGVMIHPKDQEPFPATTDDLLTLLEDELITTKQLTNIKKKDIEDKSKSDNFAKAVSCNQISWVLINIVMRRITHLPISQLELNTAGYVLCALATYVIWWHKPASIDLPTTLVCEAIPHATWSKLESHPIWYDKYEKKRITFSSTGNHKAIDRPKRDIHIPSMLIIFFVILVYNGVDIFAWNFSFPTEAERDVWRVSAICASLACLIYTIVTMVLNHTSRDLPCFHWITKLALPLYIVMRLVLISLSLTSLRALPPAVYSVPSPANIYNALYT